MKKINLTLSISLLLAISVFAQVDNEKNKKFEFVKNKCTNL